MKYQNSYSLYEVEAKMKQCFQVEGMNMLQHGELVHEWFQFLIGRNSGSKEHKKPEWFDFLKERHYTNFLRYEREIYTYHRYHDCGKPYCEKYGLSGSDNRETRFPEHHYHSFRIFQNIDFSSNDKFQFKEVRRKSIEKWINHDMVIHTKNKTTIKEEFLDPFNWGEMDAVILLFTALSELHANAQMFGGIQSDSFKIKYKKVTGNGKMITKYFNPEWQK